MQASEWLWLSIAAGVLAVVYGVVSMLSILKLPAGNARMQEIAAAIQAGAKAYLNRQYATITVVGVVLFVLLGFALGWPTAGGFAPTFSKSLAISRFSDSKLTSTFPLGKKSGRSVPRFRQTKGTAA